MSVILPLVAILGSAGAAAASACPSQPLSAAGVIATETAWVSALQRRDSAALECILDPAFSDNDWRGRALSRATVLANLPHRAASTLHLSELKTTLEGSMAMVRGLNTQTGPDGTIAGAVRFTDVFVCRNHRWRAVAAQETLVRP